MEFMRNQLGAMKMVLWAKMVRDSRSGHVDREKRTDK